MRQNSSTNPTSVLIIGLPKDIELPNGIHSIESGIKISNLLSIHKIFSIYSLDWEIGTLEGEKPSIIHDDSSEESVAFYRNNLEKFNSPISLNEVHEYDHVATIIPNNLGFIANFKGEPIISLISEIFKRLYISSKAMICIGHGISASFECKDKNK